MDYCEYTLITAVIGDNFNSLLCRCCRLDYEALPTGTVMCKYWKYSHTTVVAGGSILLEVIDLIAFWLAIFACALHLRPVLYTNIRQLWMHLVILLGALDAHCASCDITNSTIGLCIIAMAWHRPLCLSTARLNGLSHSHVATITEGQKLSLELFRNLL